MRVLVVEDSPTLLGSLCEGLRRSGFVVDAAPDGEEGLWYAESYQYDVIILDIMLPKMDGLSVLKRLRGQGRKEHVLLLTARDSTLDRVGGLDAGADDYVVKPFEFPELLARVRALARRQYNVKQPLVQLAPALWLDTARRLATTAAAQGQALPLTAREYALLEYLAFRKNEVVTRTELELHIYDDRAEPMSNVVEVAICTLRRKLEQAGAEDLIQTRRGQGYMLTAPEESEAGR